MKAIISFALVIIVFALMEWYLAQAFKTVTRDAALNTKRISQIIYWLIALFSYGTLVAALLTNFRDWPVSIRMYFTSVILVFFFVKLLIGAFLLAEDVFRLGNFLFQKAVHFSSDTTGQPSISRSRFLSQLALLIGGAPLAMGLYGITRNAYRYTTHRIKINLAHLPEAFNGLKIVQISDIHSGSFTSKAAVQKGIDTIMGLKPDVVFFTGDLVNYAAHEMDDWLELFKTIKAPEGVFSILGNHDYGDYTRYPNKEAARLGKLKAREEIIKVHQQLGWDLMLNENRSLKRGDDEIAIIGVENWGNRFRQSGDLKKAYAGTQHLPVKLLLSHDPTHFDHVVTKDFKDIDLTFSGHTHGGQIGIEIPGFIKWSPSKYIYSKWAGLYQEGKQYLYVNRGFGFLGFHGRLGILPEITVMELVKGD